MAETKWAGNYSCSVCRRKVPHFYAQEELRLFERLIADEFSKKQIRKLIADQTFKLKCKKCVEKANSEITAKEKL